MGQCQPSAWLSLLSLPQLPAWKLCQEKHCQGWWMLFCGLRLCCCEQAKGFQTRGLSHQTQLCWAKLAGFLLFLSMKSYLWHTERWHHCVLELWFLLNFSEARLQAFCTMRRRCEHLQRTPESCSWILPLGCCQLKTPGHNENQMVAEIKCQKRENKHLGKEQGSRLGRLREGERSDICLAAASVVIFLCYWCLFFPPTFIFMVCLLPLWLIRQRDANAACKAAG